MAVGEDTLVLEGAAVSVTESTGVLRGQLSFDNRYLYYLADVDEETGAGTLMAVDTAGMEQTSIADDVYKDAAHCLLQSSLL